MDELRTDHAERLKKPVATLLQVKANIKNGILCNPAISDALAIARTAHNWDKKEKFYDKAMDDIVFAAVASTTNIDVGSSLDAGIGCLTGLLERTVDDVNRARGHRNVELDREHDAIRTAVRSNEVHEALLSEVTLRLKECGLKVGDSKAEGRGA